MARAMASEAGSYHPDVKVIFQERACADVPTVLEWGESVFKPWVLKVMQGDRFTLFLARTHSQKDPAFIKLVQDLNGELVSVHVDRQPVDGGDVGAIVKSIGKGCFEEWLDRPSLKTPGKLNWEMWFDGEVNASEKRIMATWVFGEAWSRFCSAKYATVRRDAFLHTGLLLPTVTGKDDHFVLVKSHDLALAPVSVEESSDVESTSFSSSP